MATNDLEFDLHCYFEYIKIDAGSKVKKAGTWLCFQRRRVRHNAIYVAYTQMPGCPLCSINSNSNCDRIRSLAMMMIRLDTLLK